MRNNDLQTTEHNSISISLSLSLIIPLLSLLSSSPYPFLYPFTLPYSLSFIIPFTLLPLPRSLSIYFTLPALSTLPTLSTLPALPCYTLPTLPYLILYSDITYLVFSITVVFSFVYNHCFYES